MPTFHLIIKGKVQGVFYRASASKMAGQLDITGWVKNTKDGHVEIIAHGSEEQLTKFLEWCKTGPSEASVEEVSCEQTSETGFKKFEILR